MISSMFTMEKINTIGLFWKEMMYFAVKRFADIMFAILGLILLIPVTCVVKILSIIHKDFQTIFYKQNRVGKNGKIFSIYKFRTMCVDADEKLIELLKDAKYKEEWDKYQKITDDPRITFIGKILRKTSLDELPQFINIFKGEMFLIGPRPLIVGEWDEHGGDHELYESITPGLTSWWASHGRSDVTYDERLELEYYYINNKSIKLDIICVIETIKSVLGKKGVK